MSIHLMVVAAYLPPDLVTQGQKLALMKICDSADDESRRSRPGMRRLRAWVGVTEKRCTTIVTELVALGLVERIEVARQGRAAVYRVFPLGVPPIPSTEELEARHRAADQAPKNPRKARPAVQRARPSKPAMTHEDVEAKKRAGAPTAAERGEDGGAGAAGGEELPAAPADAEFHGWNPVDAAGRVPPVEPQGFHGRNPRGSTGGTPSFLSSSSALPSPPPPADAGEEKAPRASAWSCARHRMPARSCRACGTNPRAVRAEEERARVEADRQAEQRRMRERNAEKEENRRIAQERSDELADAQRQAKEAARRGRERSREARSGGGPPRAPALDPRIDCI
ncbi:hypothetical protein [Streptomyces sp. NPDC091278]|uniref:hypothetical protein n=1 Tax=Streptomyces sp. NPDC091278 TaxID=3155301 RepID=UPI00344D6120